MGLPFADYYALLGVHAGVDDEELRSAWRRLAARWHPDRAGLGATAKFQQLSAAYTVLSDPLTRMAYDRRRRVEVRGSASAPRADGGVPRADDSANAARAAAATGAASGSGPRAGRAAAPGVMLSRLTGPLASLLACGVARLDEPGFITLVVTGREAEQGGMARVSLNVELWCPACAGSAGRAASAACARCGGRGSVTELFSAWLAVPPGIGDGEVLAPSVDLPGMVEAVRFRVRLRGKM